MAYTIAFFGTKPYDESSFTDKNKEFGFEIRYYKGHLNKNNVLLTQGVDAVCIFVNDIADAEVLRIMASNGVKLLALRCAGFNNVDLNAAAAAGITVVRVPAADLSLEQVNVITRTLQSSEKDRPRRILLLAQKVQELLSITPRDNNQEKFLQTVLRDYQYYALEEI